jgi:activator of HSP90 ATPase
MVLHNPNNWHWVNKDAGPWARQWFEDNLTQLEVKEGDVSAKISKVVSMEGDVDVSQRKGKVITIYDVKLTLEYSGKLLVEYSLEESRSVLQQNHLPSETARQWADLVFP